MQVASSHAGLWPIQMAGSGIMTGFPDAHLSTVVVLAYKSHWKKVGVEGDYQQNIMDFCKNVSPSFINTEDWENIKALPVKPITLWAAQY